MASLSVITKALGFPFIILIAAVVAYFGRLVYWQPDYNKDFTNVKGIDGAVTITRDSNGFPHIRAKSRRDALFGQGFAHAQDRLWQMEFQRMVGRGQLSEIVGDLGILMDTQVRTLNFPEGSRRMCANTPPAMQELLESYVGGINFYVENNIERPPEFVFLGDPMSVHSPKPFVKTDSCLIAMLLMWQMGQNVPHEIDRFNMFWDTNRSLSQVFELDNNFTNVTGTILTAEQLGISKEDMVAYRAREVRDTKMEEELYDGLIASWREEHNPSYKTNAVIGRKAQQEYAATNPQRIPLTSRPRTMIRRYIKQLNGLRNGVTVPKTETEGHCGGSEATTSEYDLRNLKQTKASNAWAARRAMNKGEDGMHAAFGASDPHLQITNPSPWYYSHMTWVEENGQQFDVAGVGLAGLPGVHIGKTSHVSWGITMSMGDLADLFIITPDPSNPETHYIVNNTALPYKIRQEVIKVQGGKDVTFTAKDTIYGPIVTDVLELTPEVQFAYWTDYLQNDTTSLQALMCLNDPSTDTAMKVRDNCLSKIRSPGFSIPIEDKHGNLAYGITGTHPIRRAGHTGRVPIPGNGSFDYYGMIPYEELPQLTIPREASNKEASFIAAANNKIHPDGFKHHLSYDYIWEYRGARVKELLSANPEKLNDAEFHQTVQQDVRSNAANDFFENILTRENSVSGEYPEIAAFFDVVDADTKATEWFNRLTKKWDRIASVGAVEPTFFWRWWREFMRTPSDAIWAYDIDTMYMPLKYHGIPRRQLLSPTPTMTRQCQELHQMGFGALNATGCGNMAGKVFVNLANSFDVATNRWGEDYSKLTQLHVMLERTPLSRFFQNSITKKGDSSTVDLSDQKIDSQMPVSIAPSMRTLYDWSTPEWVRFIFPGGNNGNIFSKFHANLLEKYRDAQYVPVTTTANADNTVLGGRAASQTLSP